MGGSFRKRRRPDSPAGLGDGRVGRDLFRLLNLSRGTGLQRAGHLDGRAVRADDRMCLAARQLDEL